MDNVQLLNLVGAVCCYFATGLFHLGFVETFGLTAANRQSMVLAIVTWPTFMVGVWNHLLFREQD